jgi:hypothetical protein
MKTIAACALAVLVALYVVGAVSHGSLRHEVQTLPLWVPIVAGFNRRDFARWCALPCFLFWLPIMVLIWLFLLGWSRIITGTFSPVEIAMTIVVGLASAAGLFACVRGIRWSWFGAALFVLFAFLQLAAFRISMLPGIAHQ